MTHRKYLLSAGMGLVLLGLFSVLVAAPFTAVSASPGARTAVDGSPTATPTPAPQAYVWGAPSAAPVVGQPFNFDINITVTRPSRGAQVLLKFDPSVLKGTSLTQGTFYSSWAMENGGTTAVIPQPGASSIDNTTGVVTTTGDAILAAAKGGPTGSGTFLIVSFTPLKAVTSTVVALSQVVVVSTTENPEGGLMSMTPIAVSDADLSIAAAGPTSTPGATFTPSPTPYLTATPAQSPTPTPTRPPTFCPTYTPGPTYTPIPSNSTLVVSPTQASVAVGATFSVALMLTTDKATRAAQFAVSFDPAVLQCDGADEGTFYSDWAAAHGGSTMVFPRGAIDNTAGSIGDTGVFIIASAPSSDPQAAGGPTGSGVFFTLTFTAKANGSSPVTLRDVVVANDDVAETSALAVRVSDGQVTVGSGPTPTPASEAANFQIYVPLIGNAPGLSATTQPTATGTTAATSTPQPRTATPTATPTCCYSTPSPSPAATETSTPWPTPFPPPPTSTAGPGPTPLPVPPNTNMAVLSPAGPVAPGSGFDVPITVETSVEIRGLQFSLQYDPSLVQCNSVSEGTFLSNWSTAHGGSTFFIAGVISNTVGLVDSVADAILLADNWGGPTGQGLAATVHCQARLAAGTSPLRLSQVILAVSCSTPYPGSACGLTPPGIPGEVTIAGGDTGRQTASRPR